MEEMYQVQVVDEQRAASPEKALKLFLERLRNEETIACVKHLKSEEEHFIDCQTGEVRMVVFYN